MNLSRKHKAFLGVLIGSIGLVWLNHFFQDTNDLTGPIVWSIVTVTIIIFDLVYTKYKNDDS